MDPNKKSIGVIGGLAVLWLCGGGILKVLYARSEDKEKEEQQHYYGEHGAIHALYNVVARYKYNTGEGEEKDPPLGWVRVTLHRVVLPEKHGEFAEEYEQLLPYIGGEYGDGGEDRRFSIRSGIVGRAIREKSPFAAFRKSDDYDEYINEMIHEWSYPKHDARKLKSDRKSWMAVPIFGSERKVIGVVYLDAIERDFFSNDVKQLVINACFGITSYIQERYK